MPSLRAFPNFSDGGGEGEAFRGRFFGGFALSGLLFSLPFGLVGREKEQAPSPLVDSEQGGGWGKPYSHP